MAEAEGASAKPWERQAGESAKAFGAFERYRDMEERSLVEVTRKTYAKGRQNLAQIKGWWMRWGWVERVRALDEEVSRVRLERRLRAIERMEDRQAEQAERVEEAIAASILRDLEAHDEAERRLAGDEPLEPHERRALEGRLLSVHQRRLMWETASRLRRRALGEPETIEERRQKLGGTVGVRHELVSRLAADPRILGEARGALRDALSGGAGAARGDDVAGPVGREQDRGGAVE